MYVAQPPLFKLQKGSTVKYAYNEDEMKQLSAEMPLSLIHIFSWMPRSASCTPATWRRNGGIYAW